MFTTGQSDVRERALGAAYDYPAAEWACGSLTLRPFSINAHRRSEVMGLIIVTHGFPAAREMLSPGQLQLELDRLFWLLAAPLGEVQSAFRLDRVESVSQPCSLPTAEIGRFANELDRTMKLCEAALFDTEPRDAGGKSASESPPSDQIHATIMAGTIAALCERLHASEEWVMEWLPLCRALQYVHVIQQGNPSIWTIQRTGSNAGPDPYGAEIDEDEGVGEPIDF